MELAAFVALETTCHGFSARSLAGALVYILLTFITHPLRNEVEFMNIDIFTHIAQITPGFIGVAAAKFMDFDCRPAPLSQWLSKYFLYAGASWLLATFLTKLAEMIGITVSGTAFAAMSMLIALTLGLLWHGVILKGLLKLHNKVNAKLGCGQGFLANNLLEEVLDDKLSHYLIAHKGGEVVASGWLVKCITHERSFYLEHSPEWEEYLRQEEKDGKVKRRSIIFADSDYYFEEYTYDTKGL